MSAKNDNELNLNFDEYIRQGGTSEEREGRGLARSYWFAGCGWPEGIRLLAGTCPKKYRGGNHHGRG